MIFSTCIYCIFIMVTPINLSCYLPIPPDPLPLPI